MIKPFHSNISKSMLTCSSAWGAYVVMTLSAFASASSSVSITKISGWLSSNRLATRKHLLERKKRKKETRSIWTFDTSSFNSPQFLTRLLSTLTVIISYTRTEVYGKIIIDYTEPKTKQKQFITHVICHRALINFMTHLISTIFQSSKSQSLPKCMALFFSVN